VWQRMGRGFVREYLDKSRCDLLIGIPSNFRPVLTTRLTTDRLMCSFHAGPDIGTHGGFDSPDLRRLKIGVQVLEEEYAPPGEALSRRGLQGAIVGFDTTGMVRSRLFRAVARREVDIAVVWVHWPGILHKDFPAVSHSLRWNLKSTRQACPLLLQSRWEFERAILALRTSWKGY